MGTPVSPDAFLPTTLTDLLSNTLVLRQTAPYLPVSSIYALAATSKSLQHIVNHSPDVFRYLDLSNVKSALVPYEPLDSGGISWRAERMDESLTEDEFYSGPIRGIFSKLHRRYLLQNVHTLVLDGLSVPADLVRDIIAEDQFNVRILSIREAKNLNERKLMQVLRYAVRPTRPTGTPRIKGLYFFGPRDPVPVPEAPLKRRTSPNGAMMDYQSGRIGAKWNRKSSDALITALARTEDKWYQGSGRMVAKKLSLEWAETLRACEGIIAFDAVLCRGPRHDPSRALKGDGVISPASYLNPAIATVALGPAGCDTCHSSPEGPAEFGHSKSSELPLLSPLPLHSSSVRACQIPRTTDGSKPPLLFVRCEDCLKGRWCERCNKWWDESCYTGSTVAQRTELQQTEFIESVETNGATQLVSKEVIKLWRASGDGRLMRLRCIGGFRIPAVVAGGWPVDLLSLDPQTYKPSPQRAKTIGVRRDCFGCGHTCISCKEIFIRTCDKCSNEYCLEDNDASSATRCDWCNYTSRRTLEMY